MQPYITYLWLQSMLIIYISWCFLQHNYRELLMLMWLVKQFSIRIPLALLPNDEYINLFTWKHFHISLTLWHTLICWIKKQNLHHTEDPYFIKHIMETMYTHMTSRSTCQSTDRAMVLLQSRLVFSGTVNTPNSHTYLQ